MGFATTTACVSCAANSVCFKQSAFGFWRNSFLSVTHVTPNIYNSVPENTIEDFRYKVPQAALLHTVQVNSSSMNISVCMGSNGTDANLVLTNVWKCSYI